MLSRIMNRLEEGFIAFLLGAMTLITFSQVVARYLFNSGAVWALELTTYLFAWLVLVGVSYAVKTGGHLGVDAFVRILPSRQQRVLVVIAGLLCCTYAGIMLFGAWDYWTKILRFGIDTEDLYIPLGTLHGTADRHGAAAVPLRPGDRADRPGQARQPDRRPRGRGSRRRGTGRQPP